eukprot:10853087-Ditylum_brightwellii.AAC.1
MRNKPNVTQDSPKGTEMLDAAASECTICCNSLNEPPRNYQENPLPTNDNDLSIAFRNCGAY